MKNKMLCLFISLSLFSLLTNAAVKKDQAAIWKNYNRFFASAPKAATVISLTPEQLKNIANSNKNNKSQLRTTAAAESDSLSTEFKFYRNKISNLNPSQTDELDQILKEMDSKYPEFKANDIKLFTALMTPMVKMRGILWNVSKTTEGQIGQTEIYAGLIRNMYESARSSNNEHTELFLNYLYHPYKGMFIFNSNRQAKANSNSFATITPPMVQLQNIIARDFYPDLETLSDRLKNLNMSEAIPIDLKMLAPNLPKGYPQIMLFGQNELSALRASVYLALAKTATFLAYDHTNYPQYLSTVMKRTNQVIKDPVGLLPEKSIEIIKDYSIYKLTPSGTQWLTNALIHYKNAYTFGDSVNDAYMAKYTNIITSMSAATEVKIADENAATKNDLKALILDEQATLINKANGSPLKVNVGQLFRSPPNAYTFFPTKFEGGDSYIKIASQSVFNPHYGQPTEWDMSKFQPYFPGAKEQDIPFIQATLSALGLPYAGSIK